MSYEDDKELMDAVDQAVIEVLGKEIREDTGGDPERLERTRRASVEICRRAGLLEILRAVSADGELRPPPTWPQADIVPVGGGPGFLDTEVRTFVVGKGIIKVPMRLAILTKPTQAQIGDVYERGYWYLKKLVNS